MNKLFYVLSVILLISWAFAKYYFNLHGPVSVLFALAIMFAIIGVVHADTQKSGYYEIEGVDPEPAHASTTRFCKYKTTTFKFTKLSGKIAHINLHSSNGKFIDDGFYLELNGHSMFNNAIIPTEGLEINAGDVLILHQPKICIGQITLEYASMHSH